jgi:hypothetical protein
VLKVSYLQHARSYVSLAGFEWAQRLLHAMQCMLPVSRRVMQLPKPLRAWWPSRSLLLSSY